MENGQQYIDSLVVSYRPSLTSEWVRLYNFSAATDEEFQLDSLSLPNPSDHYQICFTGYGTDGYGIYPKQRPLWDTAFVFMEEDYTDVQVPPWAIKLIIEKETLEEEEKLRLDYQFLD